MAGNPSTLVIRADAGVRMGTGHLMRCLALAQAWQDAGGAALLVAAPGTGGQEPRLRDEGLEIAFLSSPPGSYADAQQTAEVARRCGATWVVLDGYHFDADYQRAVKESGLNLLVMDDYGHAEYYWADFVVNQNLYAEEAFYRNRDPHCHLLLGPRFALLRREFLKWCDWQRAIPEIARKVLVVLGGGDADNVTQQVVESLDAVKVQGLEAVVVAGANNPHHAKLRQAVERCRTPIRLLTNASDISELLAWADVAIAGGGSTNWELAFMGLPAMIVALADNQRPVVERLDKERIAVSLGWHEEIKAADIARRLKQVIGARTQREAMARRGRQWIDGEDAARVCMQLTGDRIRLRKVQTDDCRLVGGWANDPETRARSFSTDSIPREDHAHWFQGKLNDPQCHFFLGVNRRDESVGQVRIDLDDGGAAISISVAKEARGHGYGTALISSAVAAIFRETPVAEIQALIKPDNVASLRAFEKAGFRRKGLRRHQGNDAVEAILRRAS